MATMIQMMDSKNGNMLPCSENIHMFYYDGTCMTMPSIKYNILLGLMEKSYEDIKKDVVLSGHELTIENIKAHCMSWMDNVNAQLLASDGGDTISFKKLRKAWGKDASLNEVMWCQNVWVLENKCGVPSSDTFGYLGMGVDARAYEGMTISKPNLKCGNPSCDHRYPYMKKCSVCKTERYCSAECQKIHWKIHKKVCGK